MLQRTGNETRLAWSFFGIFGILAILVMINASLIQGLDNGVFNGLTLVASPSLTAIFKLVATLASPAVTLVIALVFSIGLYVTHHQTLGLLAIITMFGGDVVAFIMKNIVRRARPTQQLVPDTGFSFPSGHVFGTVLLVIIVVAISLQLISSQPLRVGLVILGIIWVLIVMVSRVYLRDHYASDTLGSVFLASGCWYQAKAWYARWQETAQRLLNWGLRSRR